MQRDTDYRNRTIYLLVPPTFHLKTLTFHTPLASSFRHQQIGFEVTFNQTLNLY